MKNLKNIFVFLLFVIYFSSCQNHIHKDYRESLNRKHAPSDFSFLQRSGISGFDISAYENGLKQARNKIQNRDVDPFFDNEWTVQGPGNIGARINTIAVDPTDENTIYAGFSTGGIFKTLNGGEDWFPIFDDQIFTSIGDIVIDPNDNNTIFVGTGDPNISGYPFIGDGIYKSTNGGDSWTHLGLEEGRIISKIIVDPTDSDNIYVACMGLPMERNENRGLYKTTDGGQNWEKVLFISEQAGIIDMVIDPNDPNVILAAGWDRIRNNHESLITGQAAKIYKTTNGGDSWTIIQNGLPQEDLCRIGLTVFPSSPAKVYAIYIGVDFDVFGIYRSDDFGVTWSEINTDGLAGNFSNFGWYFGKIRVNPNNPNDISVLSIELYRTLDNGENWFMQTPPWYEYSVHADKHDMIFTNSGDILLATDGGLYKSEDNGNTWEDIENIPTNQVYRVEYNPHYPDYYFCGMQDNGTAVGNADSINQWIRVAGGDGFQPRFDRNDSGAYYYEFQKGHILQYIDNFFWQDISDDFEDDRKNWDMPYFISYLNDNSFLYCGTYKVYIGAGEYEFNWTPISDDLTDGNIYGEKYHNISALAGTKDEPILIIAGTSDGNVWRKESESTDWTRIDDFGNDLYVSDVFISPTENNRIFVSQSGYKSNDFSPHLFRSDNLGEDWVDISGDLPPLSINTIFVLPGFDDNVIFVANDGGVYGTLNAGEHWERLGENMPIVQVFDLDYNPLKNELIAGTFGRSVMTYSLDDILVDIKADNPKSLFAKNTVKIYPNPASDFIRIEFQKIERGLDAEIVILDMRGEVVLEISSSNNLLNTSIKHLPSGKYTIKIKERNNINTGVFIKI